MLFDELYKEDLNRAMVNGSWLVLEDVLTADFGWDLPVYYLQYCADKEVGTPIGLLSYQLSNAHNIKDINYYIENLNKFLRKKIEAADILLSFSEKSTGNISIDRDILFWQALGKAKVELELDNAIITKEINQGDLIYLSSKDKYKIIPVTARATVAFFLEEEPNENSNSTTA